MILSSKLLAVNPFIQAYSESDLLGKMIFAGLLFLSVMTWVVLIYKIRQTRRAMRLAFAFQEQFVEQRHHPLNIDGDLGVNPFVSLYLRLKGYVLDMLNKNQRFGQAGATGSYLSPEDIDLVGAHVMSAVSSEARQLERYLYLLSTIVSLAPFLGLLGTVWGILTTFSEPQMVTEGGSTAVLAGISLALVTTVLGLINAIPALIGYNYLKDQIGTFETAMEAFAGDVLSSVELQYRRVDRPEAR